MLLSLPNGQFILIRSIAQKVERIWIRGDQIRRGEVNGYGEFELRSSGDVVQKGREDKELGLYAEDPGIGVVLPFLLLLLLVD